MAGGKNTIWTQILAWAQNLFWASLLILVQKREAGKPPIGAQNVVWARIPILVQKLILAQNLLKDPG